MSEIKNNRLGLSSLMGRGMLPAELRYASGMKRLDYIESLPDTTEFIESLEAQELYLLIRDIGKKDAYVLLEHASKEQLASIMDIEIWHKDRVELGRWFDWFELAQACDFETALKYVEATEPELFQLLFTREVAVYGKDLDKDMVPDELEIHTSPDMMFYFTIPVGHELAERLPMLLKHLWASDPDRIRGICHAARFDLATSVEESLYRFRNGRLEDLGFGNQEEAEQLFEIINVKDLRLKVRASLDERPQIQPLQGGRCSQELVLRHITAPDLLSQALGGLEERERLQFAEAFGALVNRVFLARTRDLSMTDELREAGSQVVALVNLGLSYLADESVAGASKVLKHIWPLQLFRSGHSLTMLRGLRARRLRLRSGANRGLSLFPARVEETLAALAFPMPMVDAAILKYGDTGRLWLSTPSQLALVDAHLNRASVILGFFEEKLGFSPEALMSVTLQGVTPEVIHRIRFATLLRTGLAQLALTDEFGFSPLERTDIVAFLALGVEDGGLSATLVKIVDRLKEQTPAEVADFIDDALQELTLALGRVYAADITPEYAAELFLVR